MRVAIIHYRLIHFGGLETRFKNYIEEFHRLGHEVTAIYVKKSPDVILPKGVKEIKIELGLIPKLFRTWFFNKRLKKVMKSHDFDFSLSMGRTSHQKAVLAPTTHKGYLLHLGKKSRTIKDKIETRLDEMAYSGSSYIYAASEMVRREIIELYHGDSSKIKVVYPPLNQRNYFFDSSLNQREMKLKYGLSPEKISFLLVSHNHFLKGLPLLEKVFSDLTHLPIELGVVGSPSFVSSTENVKYLGFHQNLREIYHAADCLVHPSKYEPFGQIIAEALACGTPVIISANVGAKEILTPRIGKVIESLDENEWKDAVRNFRKEDFNVTDEVLKQNLLYLEDHVKAMLAFAGK